MAHLLRVPDLTTQRAAMKKLGFLVGKWNGEARLLRGPGEWMDLHQSEEAQYKLDGLILVIEGVGRTKSHGHPVLQAFGQSLSTTKLQPIACVPSTMVVFWKAR
jgi:hypothetical protein